MAASFYFYDLETSGFDARRARIMQFAGQRTDMDLRPIGEPLNYLIKLTADILPQPEAVLVTGLTPQRTLAEGITEAEFLKLFYEQAVDSNTIFVGFNSIRFDDEFMRFLHYRNFYDAYEWQWADGCGRWDLLDVVRMTRALRPEGIEWPFAPDGKASNRLEYLTAVNKLEHANAHDALSDIQATIAVARLIKSKQPKLFDFLLSVRDKRKVAQLVETGDPFVYTSGKYPSEFGKTTAAVMLSPHPTGQGALVYDLRHDPSPFLDMSADELLAAWRYTKDPDAIRLPVKTLKYNRCPAVAPLGVIKDPAAQSRLGLTLDTISQHAHTLRQHHAAFTKKLLEAVSRLDDEQTKQQDLIEDQLTVDSRLYDSFVPAHDKKIMAQVRASQPEDLNQRLAESFQDQRLKSLLFLYKARNYPQALETSERTDWDNFCRQQLLGPNQKDSPLAAYFQHLEELHANNPTDQQAYLLEELKLYGQSIMPVEADAGF